MSKRLAWRCRDIQQQRDKAEIYNSKEWRLLKERKKQANPLCEMCIEEGRKAGVKRGYIHSVECVHHKIPIETAHNMEEMRRLAFDWNNLQSLCKRHHHEVHNQQGYHTREAVQERKQSAFERWKERQQRGQSGACISSAEHEAPRTECKARQQRQQQPTDSDAPT